MLARLVQGETRMLVARDRLPVSSAIANNKRRWLSTQSHVAAGRSPSRIPKVFPVVHACADGCEVKCTGHSPAAPQPYLSRPRYPACRPINPIASFATGRLTPLLPSFPCTTTARSEVMLPAWRSCSLHLCYLAMPASGKRIRSRPHRHN
jgi:hypothetical protein